MQGGFEHELRICGWGNPNLVLGGGGGGPRENIPNHPPTQVLFCAGWVHPPTHKAPFWVWVGLTTHPQRGTTHPQDSPGGASGALAATGLDDGVMVVGGRHEGQKKARIEYFQTKAVAMECGGRVLTGIADLPGRGEASG